MKVLFYLWGIINLILFTLPYILTPAQRTETIFNIMGWWKSLPFKRGSKTEKKFKLDDVPSDFKTTVIGILIGALSMFFWMIIGLFSFNWVVFLGFLIYIFVVGKLGSYYVNHGLRDEYTVYVFIHNLLVAAMIIFVTINSFHLKIDMWQVIQSLF